VLFYGVRIPVSAPFAEAARKHKGRDVILGLRPEHLGAESEIDWASETSVSGSIEILEPLGHEVIVHFDVQGQTVAGRLRSHRSLPAPGDPITLKVRTDAMHLFDPVSEQRLS
jgi:multiple sugar transport system ATP-binding protein